VLGHVWLTLRPLPHRVADGARTAGKPLAVTTRMGLGLDEIPVRDRRETR